jgi:hypothetical protein
MHRLLLLVFVAACVQTTYSWTPASGLPISPKPENCTFDVLTTPPTDNYDEIGTLDLYNGEAPKTPDAFRAAVSKQVCRVGGDAVIAISDDKGRYTKGSVIKLPPKR